jgi:hypothetical protein
MKFRNYELWDKLPLDFSKIIFHYDPTSEMKKFVLIFGLVLLSFFLLARTSRAQTTGPSPTPTPADCDHDGDLDDLDEAVECPTPTPTDTPTPTPTPCGEFCDQPTPTPTPEQTIDPCLDRVCATPTDTPTPTPTPCVDNPNSEFPVICDTPTPDPTPTPGDMCTNIDGFQGTIPDGWYQLNTDSTICRQFDIPGPGGGGSSGGGTSGGGDPGRPVGQVLGASTTASAGYMNDYIGAGLLVFGFALTLTSAYVYNKKGF